MVPEIAVEILGMSRQSASHRILFPVLQAQVHDMVAPAVGPQAL